MPFKDVVKKETHSPPTLDNEDAKIFPSSKDLIQKTRRLSTRLRLTSKTSPTTSPTSSPLHPPKSSTFQKFSDRLHLRKVENSENVPDDLPMIKISSLSMRAEESEISSEWEKRATCLAKNDMIRNRLIQSSLTSTAQPSTQEATSSGVPLDIGQALVSSELADDSIQEAIRLHEYGDLEASTEMFGRLADLSGKNNALSQVLYGLSLRHGWGCTPDPAEAIKYLSAAASNAATIEELALQAGMKNGGAAKGELVLAIFELANCFRHGWGVQEDKVAAKQYYETAANLGDTDAMNEVARCYLEGLGCRKDKVCFAEDMRILCATLSETINMGTCGSFLPINYFDDCIRAAIRLSTSFFAAGQRLAK